MYCQHCGQELAKGTHYCFNCGKEVIHANLLENTVTYEKKISFTGKFTGIFSMVFGAIALPGVFSNPDVNFISVILCVGLIVLGLFTLINAIKKQGKEKGFIIALLVIFSVMQVVTLLVLVDSILSFFVYQAIVGPPFISAILYLVFRRKEKALKEKEKKEETIVNNQIPLE